MLFKADWALLTSKWNKKREGAQKNKHTHTGTHLLTPLSGNVVQASSVVAHRLSIRVSAKKREKKGKSRRKVDKSDLAGLRRRNQIVAQH